MIRRPFAVAVLALLALLAMPPAYAEHAAPVNEAQIPHTLANPFVWLGSDTNTAANGGSAAPSAATAALAHYYSGLTVQSSFVRDDVAASATLPEQTSVFRMTSAIGQGGPGLIYKMPWGSEGTFNAGSAPGWGGTIVGTFGSGYFSGNSQIDLELDHNNNSGTNCADGDLGFSLSTTASAASTSSTSNGVTTTSLQVGSVSSVQVGSLIQATGISAPGAVVTAISGTTVSYVNSGTGTVASGASVSFSTVSCMTMLLTGAGSNQITAALAISGFSKYRNGIQFNSGGPVATSLRDYSSSQVVLKDTGSHINGFDGQGATYSGNYLVGPLSQFLVGPQGQITVQSVATAYDISIAANAQVTLKDTGQHINGFDGSAATYSGKSINLPGFGVAGTTSTVPGLTTLPALVTTVAPTASWSYDNSGAGVPVATNGTLLLPTGSGLILLREGNAGNQCLFLAGSGTVNLINQTLLSCSNSAASGKISLAFASNNYTITNGTSSSDLINVTDFRNAAAN